METFFDSLAQDTTEYQTWTGELYLERHQGTYTTQGRNKRFNRKMELALRELEFAATLAGALVGHTYPTQELDAIWKEILLYQFHDILPGSSITRVYDESLARYQQLFEQTQQLLSQAQAALIPQPDAAQNSQSVTVFNSLSWERSEWLLIHNQWHYVTAPSLGYTTLNLATHLRNDEALKGLIASTDVLENDKLRVSFAADGTIQAIFDKEHQREVLAPDAAANRLAVYHDEPYEFDAWEVSITYDKRPPKYFRLEKTESRIDGPQAIVEQHYHFGQSTLQQHIVLTAGSRRIDFITTVDWQESHKMLRTSFPVAILATEATCDIQFGWTKRPTHRNTSWDMAKYEICAHKWIDLSQWDYGVALLNDCKYGHKVSENILDLNLLRSPSSPDPQADRAQHEFTYALYPHAGNHIVGSVVRAGYELNVPLRSIPGTPQQSHRPASLSFARIEAENVIIETIKKAEKSDDIILRLYEASGATTRTTLTFDREIKAIWRTNLLEEPEKSLDHQQRSVELTLSPFEILTLRVQF
jgi:alpha-mannosidase